MSYTEERNDVAAYSIVCTEDGSIAKDKGLILPDGSMAIAERRGKFFYNLDRVKVQLRSALESKTIT